MKLFKKLSFIVSFLVVFSCSDSLDFNQIEDYVYEPIYTSALTFFSVSPIKFFNPAGIQENEITHIDDFSAFQRDFVKNSVVKIDFNAETKNEFDRDVTIIFDFLNETNDLVYSASPIFIEANTTTPSLYLEEIIIADNPDILTASFVRVKASLEDTGTSMNPNDTSKFEFKSSITLYIKSEL